MNKSPDAFRTISEVADWLGTPAHVLRFWESRFSQVKPVKRAGGRRYYRPSDMVLLGGIKKLLHDDGMTIRGVQKLLREHGVRYVASMSPQIEGVDPVEPPRESVGPVPAAPMAEDVPTGAFDPISEVPEERIIPFSRPEIPAQTAPIAASKPTVAPPIVAPTPAENVRPDLGTAPPQTIGDVPEDPESSMPQAPMVEVDAPLESPFEQSIAADAARSTETAEQGMTPPEDTTPAPAQVTFDFGFDAKEDAPEATPLADDAAFETALQDALATPDTDVKMDVCAPPIPEAGPEIVEDSVPSVEAAEGVVNQFEVGTGVPNSEVKPVAEIAPEATPSFAIAEDAFDDATLADDTSNAFGSEITSDLTPFEPNIVDTPASNVDDVAHMDFSDQAEQNDGVVSTDIASSVASVDDIFMGTPDPHLDDVAATLEPSVVQELHDVATDENASAEAISDASQYYAQTIPTEVIPDDLEDDAMGIDVPEGIIGRLNTNALATADPLKVQAVFDRAMTLKTKLSKAG
jgi:DNA-binding transcriptional MerR regulator